MPQLVAFSGCNPFQLPSHPPPWRMPAAPPEPPFIEMPPGVLDAPPAQTVALPGGPSPCDLKNFHAPEPTGGRGAPAAQLEVTAVVAGARLSGKFQPAIAMLESGESSPNTGARNDVP